MAAATCLPANPTLPRRQISPNHHPNANRTRAVFSKTKKLVINAKKDENEGKSSVDDNMVILRMRIKKMKALEANISGDEDGKTKEAAEMNVKQHEKNMLARSQKGVGESMEALQSYLMKTKPSLALGMLVLAAITVPLSGSPVMENAINIARTLLAGCHVSIDIDF